LTVPISILLKNIIKGQFDNGLAKKDWFDRILVKISNIATQRQQKFECSTNSRKYIKIYMECL
jgi:hypothetical protein